MRKQTNETSPLPVLVSWSSGKDSAWVLNAPFFREPPQLEGIRITEAAEYCHLTYEKAM